jgi:biofilm protein TabA
MGYSNVEPMKISEPYEPENDKLILEGDGQFLVADRGTFVIFMPQDAHMPCRYYEVPGTVRKIVMKMLIA